MADQIEVTLYLNTARPDGAYDFTHQQHHEMRRTMVVPHEVNPYGSVDYAEIAFEFADSLADAVTSPDSASEPYAAAWVRRGHRAPDVGDIVEVDPLLDKDSIQNYLITRAVGGGWHLVRIFAYRTTADDAPGCDDYAMEQATRDFVEQHHPDATAAITAIAALYGLDVTITPAAEER
jgi:hypothetical protein